jgi:hypothetical protein
MDGRGIPPAIRATVWCVGLLLGVPQVSRATAGFAESHSMLHYNEAAELEWAHPGDGCDQGSYCFHVVKKGRTGWFRNLYGSFERISLPDDPRNPFVLGQLSLGKRWVLYDLAREEVVVETGSSDEALSAWRSVGQSSPVFADARSAQGLHQTWGSLFGNWAFVALLWSPLLAVVTLPALILASLTFWRRFRAARRTTDLILFGLCVAPVAGVAFLVLRILAVIMLPRPGG